MSPIIIPPTPWGKEVMNQDYSRIAKAIEYLETHVKEQPSLEELAQHVNLSSHHFHRMFVQYSGVSPKQFLQLLTLGQAKRWLDQSSSLETAALESGLSGNSRLHDHFVTIKGITPGEYKSLGRDMSFYWGVTLTEFGKTLIVWTEKGIHLLVFINDEEPEKEIKNTLDELSLQWPEASFNQNNGQADALIQNSFSNTHKPLRLWVSGSNFQISVWQALLKIPKGNITTYGKLAQQLGSPNASRAVGNAIGKNPIAYLIPCHRVIQSSGAIGGYRWKPSRKKILLAKEFLEEKAADH